jgi:surfeit locus 1 family protein
MKPREFRRVPIGATLVVLIAAALMIWLGAWQLLDRWPQKLAYLRLLEANPGRPEIAFSPGTDEALLFRRAHADCRPPVTISLTGAGASGYRAIARCADPAGAIVQLGTTRIPNARLTWQGGPVSGYIGQAPDARPLIALAYDRRPRELMLIADPPLAGLGANEKPDPSKIPNNHFSYAVQWFLFAATALVIYAVALRARARRRTVVEPEKPG